MLIAPAANEKCDPILENHPFGHMEYLWKNSNENLKKKFFFYTFSCCKVYTHSFFLLGDMSDFMRPCSDFISVKFVWDNN